MIVVSIAQLSHVVVGMSFGLARNEVVIKSHLLLSAFVSIPKRTKRRMNNE